MVLGFSVLLLVVYLLMPYTTEISPDAITLRRPIGVWTIRRENVKSVGLSVDRPKARMTAQDRRLPVGIPIPFAGPSVECVREVLSAWVVDGFSQSRRSIGAPTGTAPRFPGREASGRIFAATGEHHQKGIAAIGVGLLMSYVAIEALLSYGEIGMLGIPVLMLALVGCLRYVRQVWAIDAVDGAVVVRRPVRRRVFRFTSIDGIVPHWESRSVALRLDSGECVDLFPGDAERVDEVCRHLFDPWARRS